MGAGASPHPLGQGAPEGLQLQQAAGQGSLHPMLASVPVVETVPWECFGLLLNCFGMPLWNPPKLV